MIKTSIDGLCINTIRTLSMDAVEKAGCGHPGAPMGMAPMGYIIWTEFLRHNPKNTKWLNRDRFVLSPGHASMFLYSLLFLTGYDLTMDDIKSFRQFGSRLPGHPEYGLTPGVEVTTGCLGQGFANGVGMAIAERFLSDKFNKPNFPIVDHRTYAIVSDGDMMEGISSEAASLAGHLGLGKLIYFYDDNETTIDGDLSLSMSEDVQARFKAYGWHVLCVEDGNHDLDGIRNAICEAQSEVNRPSLIVVKTEIGYGSPNKKGSAECHGAALGEEEVCLTKEALGWPKDKHFFVPDDVLEHYRKCVEKGKSQEDEWNKIFSEYEKQYPNEAKEYKSIMSGEMPEGWQKTLPSFDVSDGPMATRAASGKVLNAMAGTIANLIGGSADCTGSNNTSLKGLGIFNKDNPGGRNLHFGVREHAMGGILNGMALHGGVIPYGGSFLIFSDYVKPSMRLAALMKIQTIFVFTHDSIGLGEDGPTHQPIEQLASLRTIPNFTVIRPSDASEVSYAWQAALEKKDGPTAIVMTRQKLPIVDRTKHTSAAGLLRGAYVIKKEKGDLPNLILIATGSEVSLALEASILLEKEGVCTRVVSFPSWEIFQAEDNEYKEEILPAEVKCRLAIEAGCLQGWREWVGDGGDVIGMTGFGASAPAKELFVKFGFTPEAVVQRAKELLKKAH